MKKISNFEYIRSLSVDGLAEYLDKHWAHDDDLSVDWWNKKYCNRCEPVNGYVEYLGKELDFAWCELNGKCKFFPELNEQPNGKQIMKM